MRRYCTWEEAERGHWETVRFVRYYWILKPLAMLRDLFRRPMKRRSA